MLIAKARRQRERDKPETEHEHLERRVSPKGGTQHKLGKEKLRIAKKESEL